MDRAVELRAVAPLVIAGVRRLVGTCTLVTNGTETLAFTSVELLRTVANDALEIAVKLDGTATIPVASWAAAGDYAYGTLAVCVLAAPLPNDPALDVAPLAMASICATTDNRGAPAAIVSCLVAADGRGFTRVTTPVFVDGTHVDPHARIASPVDAADARVFVDGAPVFAWMPAEPALGRKSEVVALAIACPIGRTPDRPRASAPIAELVGLDELARALPFAGAEAEPQLGQVAGEIPDHEA